MARPTKYTDELATRICARIAEGEPATKICKDEAFPSLTTLYAWTRERADFAAMYRNAKEDMAHTFAAEIKEISDEAPLIVDIEGQQVAVKLDMAAVQRNRLRIDSRKWVAAKLLPRIYADQVGIGAAPDLPPVKELSNLEVARRVAFILALGDQQLQEQQVASLPMLTLAYERPPATDD